MFFRKRARPLISNESVNASSATADLMLPPIPSASSARAEEPLELDTKALEQVTAMAWRVLRRLGVAEHVMADVVQDALLVVHRRLPEFRGESRFDTWVYGILLRVASDHRRGRRRAERVFASTHSENVDLQCEAPNPFEQLEQRRAADFLKTLLDHLPEPAREVFVLVELEELSLSAAAQVLRISESTAKSRLRTARQTFDIALKRELARRTSGSHS